MKNIQIHYEEATDKFRLERRDCKRHGPYYFLKDMTSEYPKYENTTKVCFRSICLACGKVKEYVFDREQSKKNCVFGTGTYGVGPSESKVKQFYDMSKLYYQLKEEGKTTEEIVAEINDKKLIR